ncbi:MAG: type II toxin-antitoxin system Phd/YefM family antitoxin [Spirochaetes bacterium]|nr:type II toxin-antitoxin system Phd/YefM family antitoxin [Spirochaetota bacterium]MBX3723961.1 type II toxin-antitoxin system Phd/YefM family antitoxin [Turneriella sp.]
MRKWQIQVAKNRLSEVVRTAQNKGPQIITQNGVETAVLLSADDYRRLKKPALNLVAFFSKSPLRGIDLDFSRKQDENRDIEI